MTPQSPTVFESFNARTLRPEQVAKTFVPPSCFRDLASRCHSTIVGPRGSGKTSLLKMLQPRALESWSSDRADDFRQSVDFTGIFVPTDIAWNRQTIACVDNLDPVTARAYRTSVFTTQVLHALVETLCWRVEAPPVNCKNPFRRVRIEATAESSLVFELAQTWGLTLNTNTLVGLKHSLSRRNAELWRSAHSSALPGASNLALPDWIGLDFLSCVDHAVEVFDDAIGEGDAKWALLFDELELAPHWIMEGLLNALRSTTPRLLFKLALSPFDEHFDQVLDALRASPLDDYNEIPLWHARKEDGSDFSTRLFLKVCEDQGRTVDSLEDLVGKSVLDEDDGETPSYAVGSVQWRALKLALESDPTFARYWFAQNIDIDKLPDLSETERAAKVRKIYPLVVLRNNFRAPIGSAQAKRQVRKGRKTLEIYRGASSLLAISEGNPRWIIGMTRLLLSQALRTRMPVPGDLQAGVLEETMHKFRARVKTISLGPSRTEGRMANVLSLTDAVGRYFETILIKGEFMSQPPLTFVVDKSTSDDVVSGIGRALNAGAIVYVPDSDSSALLHDVRGKRFRLSYLLAPKFHLLLRLGGSQPLSKILSGPRQVEQDLDTDLFFGLK